MIIQTVTATAETATTAETIITVLTIVPTAVEIILQILLETIVAGVTQMKLEHIITILMEINGTLTETSMNTILMMI